MINLTPHTVTVRKADGNDNVYPPSGHVARVQMQTAELGGLDDGTPVSSVDYGEAVLPPDIGPGPYIVSTMFADAYRRQHPVTYPILYTPDSGPSAIRENGQIVAVRSLILR